MEQIKRKETMNQASSFEQAFDQMVERFGHEQRIPLDGWKQLRAILRTTEPDSKFDPVQYWQDRYGNGPSIVNEIRREGQRILQAGTNVHVQPEKRKGTKRYEGWIVECYSDNTVKISVPILGDSIVVEADEFVKARRGTTKGRN